MRIVYLSTSGALGGAERSLLDVLGSVREACPRWHLHLLSPEDGPLVEEARSLALETQVAPFPPALAGLGDADLGARTTSRWASLFLAGEMAGGALAAVAYVAKVRGTLRRLRPDVIHSNGFKMHVVAAHARPNATPVIWHIRDFVSGRPLIRRLLRLSANRCAAVIANSAQVAEDVRAVCGRRLPVIPIYNAIDLERFSPRGTVAELDRLAGLPVLDAVVRVGLVATYARWKGHATFLKAMSLLPCDLPVRGYVIGGPVYRTSGSQYEREELKRLSASLELGERVGFTGFVPDVASAIRALDVVVHASTRPEPFGRVIVEGMACGRPVIASKSAAAAEVPDVRDTVMMCEPGDARALATLIERLAMNTALREKLGSTGRGVAERRFDRRRLASELVPLYRGLTGMAS